MTQEQNMFKKYLSCSNSFLQIKNQNFFIQSLRPSTSNLEESYAINYLQPMLSRFKHNFLLFSGDLKFSTSKILMCQLSPLISDKIFTDKRCNSYHFSNQNSVAFKLLCQILEGKTVTITLNEKENIQLLLDELQSRYNFDSFHNYSQLKLHLFFNIGFLSDSSKSVVIKTPQKIYYPNQLIMAASDVLFEKFETGEIEFVENGCETAKSYFYDPHDDIDYEPIFSFFALSEPHTYHNHLDSLLKIAKDFKIQFAIPLIEKVINNKRIIIESFSQYDTSKIEKLNGILYESKQDEIASIAEFLKSSIWMSDSDHMKELARYIVLCIGHRYDRISPLVDLCEKLGEPFLTFLSLYLSSIYTPNHQKIYFTPEDIANLSEENLNRFNNLTGNNIISFSNKLLSKQLINNSHDLSIEMKYPLKQIIDYPQQTSNIKKHLHNNETDFYYLENDDVDTLKNRFYRDSSFVAYQADYSLLNLIDNQMILSSIKHAAVNCFKLLDSLKIYDLRPKDLLQCTSSGNEELIRYVINSISPEYRTSFNIEINQKFNYKLKNLLYHKYFFEPSFNRIDDLFLKGNILSHNNRIIGEMLRDMTCDMKPFVAIHSILANNLTILKESIHLLCDIDLHDILHAVVQSGFTEMFFLLISIYQNIFTKNEMQNLISFSTNNTHSLSAAASSSNVRLLRYLYNNSKPLYWPLDKIFDIKDKQVKLKYFNLDEIFEIATKNWDLDIMKFLVLECDYIPPSILVYKAIESTFSPNNLTIIEFLYNHNLIEIQWFPILIEILATGNTDSSFNILQQVCTRIMKEFNIKSSKDENRNETKDEDKQNNRRQFDFYGIFERAFLMALVYGRERNVEFLSQFDMPNLNQCLRLLIMNSCSLDDNHEILDFILKNNLEIFQSSKLILDFYVVGYTLNQLNHLLSKEDIQKVDYRNIEFSLRETEELINSCIRINNPNNFEFLNFLLSKGGDPTSAMKCAIDNNNFGAFKDIFEYSISNNHHFEFSILKQFLDKLCNQQSDFKTINIDVPNFERRSKGPNVHISSKQTLKSQLKSPKFYGIKCIHKKVKPITHNLDAILDYLRPFAENSIDNSMLIAAAKNNHLNLVEYLLSFNKLNLNSVSDETLTPLMYATLNGNRKMFDLLFYSPSIDVNKLTDLKRSVLSYAIISLPEVVPLILNNGNSKKIVVPCSNVWCFDPQKTNLCTVLASCFYTHNLELFDKILEFDFNLHQKVLFVEVGKYPINILYLDAKNSIKEKNIKSLSIFEIIILYGKQFSLPFLKHLVNHKNFAKRSKNVVIIDNEEWPLFNSNDSLFDDAIEVSIDSSVDCKFFEILLRISGNNVNLMIDNTPLIVYAAKNNNLRLIDFILNSPEFDPNYLHQGHAAFCIALCFQYLDVAIHIYNKIKIDINEYVPDCIRYPEIKKKHHMFRPGPLVQILTPLPNPKFSEITVFKHSGIEGVDKNCIDNIETFLSLTSTDDDSIDITGLTPFSLTILNPYNNCFDYLLTLPGLLINKMNKNGNHPLIQSLSTGHTNYPTYCKLIKLPELQVNVTDEGGNTFIMHILEDDISLASKYIVPLCKLRYDFDFLHANDDGETIRTLLEMNNIDTTSLGPDPTNEQMRQFLFTHFKNLF